MISIIAGHSVNDVFNRITYFIPATNGHRLDVVNVNNDPGPGIVAPTIWEAYWNISGWVLDEFLNRLTAGATAEP